MSEPAAASVDTSVIVRYLIDGSSDAGRRARAIVESSQPLTLSELVIAETAYVLTKVYGVERSAVVNVLIDLVQRRNVRPLHLSKPALIEALDLCHPSGRVSFADALLWAQVRDTDSRRLYTFDREFPRQDIETLA